MDIIYKIESPRGYEIDIKNEFWKIDKDKNPNATARFNLRYAPSMILFKNEEIKCRQSIVVPLQNSLSKMKKYA